MKKIIIACILILLVGFSTLALDPPGYAYLLVPEYSLEFTPPEAYTLLFADKNDPQLALYAEAMGTPYKDYYADTIPLDQRNSYVQGMVQMMETVRLPLTYETIYLKGIEFCPAEEITTVYCYRGRWEAACYLYEPSGDRYREYSASAWFSETPIQVGEIGIYGLKNEGVDLINREQWSMHLEIDGYRMKFEFSFNNGDKVSEEWFNELFGQTMVTTVDGYLAEVGYNSQPSLEELLQTPAPDTPTAAPTEPPITQQQEGDNQTELVYWICGAVSVAVIVAGVATVLIVRKRRQGN